MAKKRTALCACGAIKFEFDIDPAFIAVCHCLDCKKASGGEAATFLCRAGGRFHTDQRQNEGVSLHRKFRQWARPKLLPEMRRGYSRTISKGFPARCSSNLEASTGRN